MRINREIRAAKVRLVDGEGNQLGVFLLDTALEKAEGEGLDLVEISPNTLPPVCKVMDYGKFRYQQAKKEKEGKKSQHQVKVKEIKFRPNIDTHDLEIKLRHAKEFIEQGDKVKVTCFFRGREMMYPQVGAKVIEKFCELMEEVAQVESPPKLLGRQMSTVLSKGAQKKKG